MLSYTPQRTKWKEEEVTGDLNRKVDLTRANIPKEEVVAILERFTHMVGQYSLLDQKILDTATGLGSTRQYRETDYQKPFAGDIDLLFQAPVEQGELSAYIDTLQEKWNAQGIKTDRSFDLLSAFIPVTLPGKTSQDTPLFLQIDLMFAAQSKNNSIYTYLKDIVYYSGEPYRPITHEDGSTNYYKGIHTSLLRENLANSKNWHMNDFGLYQETYIPTYTGKHVRQVLEILGNKGSTTDKLKLNNRAQVDWMDNWEVGKQVVDKEGMVGSLPYDKMYDEIKDILIQRTYKKGKPENFFKKEFGIKIMSTLEEMLTQLGKSLEKGLLTETQMQKVVNSYAKKLIKKNKGVLWFPAIQQRFTTLFPFLDRTEVEAYKTQREEFIAQRDTLPEASEKANGS